MPEVCGNCVLLVDDDPSVRDLFSMQLEKEGFQALLAEDGIDALVKLRYTLPKVIITDVQMPRMSGIEFIAVVRQRFPSIPVIGLTGSIPKEVLAQAKPDVWFEKSTLNTSELVRSLHDLARKVPDRFDLPQVVPTPARTRPGFAGYVILTCTECLRTFRATSNPGKERVKQTAVCVHCEAHVPFLVESSELR
jgi:CheY-like chemotaxis protein